MISKFKLMSKSYDNIVQGIDILLTNLSVDNSTQNRQNILLNHFHNMWFGKHVPSMVQDKQLRLRSSFTGESDAFTDFYMDLYKKEMINSDIMTIKKFVSPLIAFALAFSSVIANSTTKISTLIQEAILNVFLRLTNYNEGAIVPIRDLTNQMTARSIFTFIHPEGSNRKGDTIEMVEFRFLQAWNYIVEGLIYCLYKMEVKLPARYYVQFSCLEKEDELYNELRKLHESFQEKESNKI